MGKRIDLTGQKFGKLTVIGIDNPHYTSGGNRVTMWKCICECGNTLSVSNSNLKYGSTSSCGCVRHPDLTGLRFGKLKVISRSETRKGLRYWKCICDCGKTLDVRASQLTRGKTKSCGCLRKNPSVYDDLSGQRFGKLTVVERIGTKWGSPYWKCKCDCGNYTNVSSTNLKYGGTLSCGCFYTERLKTHGLSDTRLYRIYSGMKTRCYNPNTKAYHHYGGRGISICDEWLGENGFMNFYDWAMENGYSDNLSIDRIDVNGNYEPNNCRWATQETQTRNKRNNLIIEYKGVSKTLVEWSEEIGISYSILNDRITMLGWDTKKAFTTPVKKM